MENNNLLTWLNSWYINQCNGDWEHSYGINIRTVDNPGWTLEIDLEFIKDAHIINEIDWKIIELNRDLINFNSQYNKYEDINYDVWIGIGFEIKNKKFKAICSRYINLEVLVFIFKTLIEKGFVNDNDIRKKIR